MKISVSTLGCKVNQYESQAMEALLTSRGHTLCTIDEQPDICVINTCAVTAASGRKSRQLIRRVKERNPDAFIAVCGCFSQVSPEEIADLGADFTTGSVDRRQFISDLEQAYTNRRRVETIDNVMKRRIFEPLPAGSLSGRTRAMLKIQDGCDNFCTYCIIPYARGPVRSLPIGQAVEEARRLAGEGYRELVVTGIEIASYGKDFRDGTSLIDLLEALGNTGNMRLRLGSLEPRMITEEFCSRLQAVKGLCSHFHLSLQSGCDETLKRMGRKYDRSRFYESVTLLRKNFPGCGITGDLIVGFPGETEEHFMCSMAFIKECAFSKLHIFPYSPRPNTPAADMEGQLPNKIKAERARVAGEEAKALEADFLKSCVGKTYEVLFETEKDGISRGHSENYCLVEVRETGLSGTVQPIKITSAEAGRLQGKQCF